MFLALVFKLLSINNKTGFIFFYNQEVIYQENLVLGSVSNLLL